MTQPVSKPVTQPTPKPVAPPVSKPVAQPTPTPKPVAQPPKTNQPTFQGLTATYFNTPYLSGSKVTRVDRTVNFNWRNGIPAPGIGADNFSARWTGKITPRFSDVYTFYTASDDGVRVWVNGKLIINNWTDHAESDNKGYIALQAGKKYDIKMEYYEHLGQAEAKLLWASQHQIKQIVPVGALSPA